jgi:chaperone required for assembly of F1-ATPase
VAGKDDIVSRAKELQRQPLPKRFYKTASFGPSKSGGFAILLDGRPIRTPGRAGVEVPAEELARRVAAEWEGQGEEIDPATMPLTRLVNTTVESAGRDDEALRAEILRYAGSDLLLYRATEPADLVNRQREVWDKALQDFARRFDVHFEPVAGIMHRAQPEAALARISNIASALGRFSLMATISATSLAGSAILALGAAHRVFGRDFAWDAAHVDEDFNISRWGEDAEAAARRRFRRADFDAAMDVIELAGLER